MMDQITFDAFRGTPQNKPVWSGCVTGLGRAFDLANRLAARTPGEYSVFNLAARDGRNDPPKCCWTSSCDRGSSYESELTGWSDEVHMGNDYIPKQEIAARAYELYVERGSRDGCAQHDWLTAETELKVARFLEELLPAANVLNQHHDLDRHHDSSNDGPQPTAS